MRLEEEVRLNREICEKLEVKCNSSPYELYPDFEERFYDFMYAEIQISLQFFSENICPVRRGDDLMDAYYTYLKKYAIVADVEKVLPYFPKYPWYARRGFIEFNAGGKMDFKKWLEIYLHYQPKKDWSISGNAVEDREG